MEFLGDAVLDYLITRNIYEDSRTHYSGAIHELRSALVNNHIFASLAVKKEFYGYINFSSERIKLSIDKFVDFETNKEKYYTDWDDERNSMDGVEDVEPPKVLADVFESVAGAIYLDSARRLDSVWMVYQKMMQDILLEYSEKMPKSPIAELQEMLPRKVVFRKPEKLVKGRIPGEHFKFCVTVEVKGFGCYKGIGSDEKSAKRTAAKFALHKIRKITDFLPKETLNYMDEDSNQNDAKATQGNYNQYTYI